MTNPSPHRPYSLENRAHTQNDIGPVPCGCKCGQMVARDIRNQRALYVNDTHKARANRQRALERAIYEAGYARGRAGKPLPAEKTDDDPALLKFFEQGHADGVRRARLEA